MMKLIIFDWNGVLIADTRAQLEATNRVLKAYGGRKVTLKQFRDTHLVPSLEFYVRHGCDRERLVRQAKEKRNFFFAVYEPRVAKVCTRANVRKLLSWISKKHIAAVILSNHTTVGIENQLKRLGIQQYFSEIIAHPMEKTAAEEKKHKKQYLEEFLKRIKIRRKDMLIIGDSPEEVEIGKGAGIKTVAIADGYFATWRLKAAKPDYLISDVGQLIGIINKS